MMAICGSLTRILWCSVGTRWNEEYEVVLVACALLARLYMVVIVDDLARIQQMLSFFFW